MQRFEQARMPVSVWVMAWWLPISLRVLTAKLSRLSAKSDLLPGVAW
jgi:hypothetical protein